MSSIVTNEKTPTLEVIPHKRAESAKESAIRVATGVAIGLLLASCIAGGGSIIMIANGAAFPTIYAVLGIVAGTGTVSLGALGLCYYCGPWGKKRSFISSQAREYRFHAI